MLEYNIKVRVSENIKRYVENESEEQGISISDFLRNLILQDMASKNSKNFKKGI